MNVKIKFSVVGTSTLPIPPNVDFPVVPKIGDKIEYRNSGGDIVFIVSGISYEIYDGAVSTVVELRDSGDKKR